MTNLLIAIYFANHAGNTHDQCGVYFINFVLDVTVGMFFSYCFLITIQHLARKYCSTKFSNSLRSGYYGDTPSQYCKTWLIQLTLWLCIIFMTKIIMSGLLYVLWYPLVITGDWLFANFSGHRKAELITVMIICPCFLNAFQFWIQDSFLKADSPYEMTKDIKEEEEGQTLDISKNWLTKSNFDITMNNNNNNNNNHHYIYQPINHSYQNSHSYEDLYPQNSTTITTHSKKKKQKVQSK